MSDFADGANWFVVIDLDTQQPAYGGPDGAAAQAAYTALPHALMGGQRRDPGAAVRTVWVREKGTNPSPEKGALRGN